MNRAFTTDANRRNWPPVRTRLLCLLLVAIAPTISSQHLAWAYDLHYDYTSFDTNFQQSQFDVLNYPSMNGNFMMTSTDNHRPEMVANGNNLAEFYNNFNADYTNFPSRTGADEADAINAYTVTNSTKNGSKPTWMILNEISSGLWQQNPGAPSLNPERQWVIDAVTRLHDVYGYNVITYSPYETLGTTANAASWQALAAKSYIAVESYQSGTEVWNSGSTNAARLAWAQSKYQASKNTYLAAGVPGSRIFISEHFANTAATYTDSTGTHATGWGRAGLASAADWDTVIQLRQDAMYNVGFAGFLAYNWGSNAMGVTQAEQIQHEYYYRSRLVLPGQKPQWLSDSAINVNGTTIPLSWSQPLNWVGGVPNAAGAEVNFWRTLTANRTITLDGSKSLGKLTFDSPFNYTIAPGAGGGLNFNNSGTTATLTSSQGSHTIATDIQLASNLSATINSGTFTVSGATTGAGSLTKSGVGTLSFTATNSYSGNTAVQAGTLSLANRGLSDSADVSISSGGALDLKFSGNADVIDSLFLNGISQPVGTWGAIGSGAQFTSSMLAGTGLLQVTTYVPSFLTGDYNSNGIVDAADYVVWRRNIGASTIANRDPLNSGPVDNADFDAWRAHLGQTVGTGTGLALSEVAVPEPGTGLVLAAASLAIACLNSRSRSRHFSTAISR